MKPSDPLVSVVMAVYNERSYLETAVQSVLDQTFENFEFIIVNDGSTDGSKEILERLADRDERIRLVHQENKGLIASLNRGLNMARGQYVARMDGDDITHPKRFEKQINFLESNPRVGILGTQIERVDAEGNPDGQWRLPTDPGVIEWQLLFNSCLCHPTVMMRHSLLDHLDGYVEWATYAEDFELWTQAVRVSRLANLSDTLLKLRRHEESVTVSKRREQIRMCERVAAVLHRALLGSRADEQKSAFLVWMETRGLERAVEETGVQDFAAVHEYVRVLYGTCARQLRSDGLNVQARQRALMKLDVLARRLAGREGRVRGLLHKVQARCMAPVQEILPWALQAFRQRVA